MTATSDDDALSWAGENDPTLSADGATARTAPTSGRAATPPTTATPVTGATVPGAAVAGGAGDAPATAAVGDGVRGSVELVLTGILAGIYLLYTIGWFIGVGRIMNPAGEPVAAFMFSLGTWLAVAAPAVWFGVSYALTAGRPRIRLVWLILGVVLLAPVPFILGSGVGA